MQQIIFYKDKNGNEPVKEYIDHLESKATTSKNDRIKYKKIMEYIQYLVHYGTRIGEPIVEHIDDDIWELRPTSDRIFFFFYTHDGVYVLLHHYVKKSQKAPQREIEQARKNMKDFIERRKRRDENR